MPSWQQKEALSRGVFRMVNEQIVALEQTFGVSAGNGGSGSFVCECSDPKCVDRVELGRTVYESIRANPHRFLIALNHENPGAETVVDIGPKYAIVQTFAGSSSQIAEDTDPRRRASFKEALADKTRRRVPLSGVAASSSSSPQRSTKPSGRTPDASSASPAINRLHGESGRSSNDTTRTSSWRHKARPATSQHDWTNAGTRKTPRRGR